jgi:hypothetical protein
LLGVWKGEKFYSPPCWQAKIAFLRCHLNRYNDCLQNRCSSSEENNDMTFQINPKTQDVRD